MRTHAAKGLVKRGWVLLCVSAGGEMTDGVIKSANEGNQQHCTADQSLKEFNNHTHVCAERALMLKACDFVWGFL